MLIARNSEITDLILSNASEGVGGAAQRTGFSALSTLTISGNLL
ncbi:hypothetical protein [Nostoc spongiaeforme]|nr:hypothetical protein [Nostoc spongiaeforme]